MAPMGPKGAEGALPPQGARRAPWAPWPLGHPWGAWGTLLWGPRPWVPPLGPPRFARNNRNCAARKLRCEYAALRRNCAACKWVGGHARSVKSSSQNGSGIDLGPFIIDFWAFWSDAKTTLIFDAFLEAQKSEKSEQGAAKGRLVRPGTSPVNGFFGIWVPGAARARPESR